MFLLVYMLGIQHKTWHCLEEWHTHISSNTYPRAFQWYHLDELVAITWKKAFIWAFPAHQYNTFENLCFFHALSEAVCDRSYKLQIRDKLYNKWQLLWFAASLDGIWPPCFSWIGEKCLSERWHLLEEIWYTMS